MYRIDLTPLFQAVIAVLAALITHKLIPWIKAKTTENQRRNLETLCRTLVYAAEQIFGNKHGQEKMEYVLAELKKEGYDVDINAVKSAVEAAVREMNLSPFQTLTTEQEDGIPVDVRIDHWTLEQLKLFCELNGIDAIGCVTREDYMDAIERGGIAKEAEPPTIGGAD